MPEEQGRQTMAGLTGTQPLRVGLVGAGPWAYRTHAPMLSAGPETQLSAVWARKPEAAEGLAAKYGAAAPGTFDQLLGQVDAVAFCVPPPVQAALAIRAARAGKAVLLEKPIAGDLESARILADEIRQAGAGNMLMLTGRYTANVREFLARAAEFPVTAGRAWRFSGSAVSGAYAASPWRGERLGTLYDLGPHSLDLLDAAIGNIIEVRAAAFDGTFALTLRHQEGQISQVMISASVGAGVVASGAHLVGPSGELEVTTTGPPDCATLATIRREFAQTANGGAHVCNVERGLHLQTLLENAAAQL